LKVGLVGGQRLQQEGALQRHVDDLFSQLFESAQRHVGHGHLLQIRDVLFQVLERLLELQREQAAQSGAVARGGNLRLIEDLDRDRVADVDQRRKADDGLPALADFHELGQFAESPGGVALAGSTSRHIQIDSILRPFDAGIRLFRIRFDV
jgi:hypothetical protein